MINIWDGTLGRYALGVILPFVSFKVKCVVATLGVPYLEKRFKLKEGLFDREKQFRLIGWDYASSSLGIVVFAILSEKSGIRVHDHDLGLPWIILMLSGFAVSFVFSVMIRYIIQEQRERDYAERPDELAIRELAETWGTIGWLIGIACYGVAMYCAIV